MYQIIKVINNNIVCSVDLDGSEIILRGLGIGFQKKAGESVADDKIEKIYKMSNPTTSNKLQELLAEIPIEYVKTCTDIIDYAKSTLGKRLNENIYITLTDHISFAIERKKSSLEYQNALLTEIKRFYHNEYQVGLYALKIIKEKLNITLSTDEAGFIALHIVNAELDTDMPNMVNITEMIQQILDIIKAYYKIELEEESLHYDRFITHLKYFGQRLFHNKHAKEGDVGFNRMIKEHYPNDYGCAEKIRDYVEQQYHKRIGEEEMVFLTVHLKRITDDTKSDCDYE